MGAKLEQNGGAAARLSQSDREELAILPLARSKPISDLAVQHRVSRKFVYAPKKKARCVLDEAFIAAATDDTVRFEIPVTKRWLRQVIVALTLMCRSSYLGILELMRDVLGSPISIGTIHNVLHAAAEQARVINGGQDLSGIRVGLLDELFHGERQFWLASVPRRITAIPWPRRITVTLTPGACICSTLLSRG